MKNYYNSTTATKRDNPVKKLTKGLNSSDSKKPILIQITSKHVEGCSISLIIREMQTTTRVRDHFTQGWL